MKCGRIYPRDAASWSLLWPQSPRTISNDRLITGDRTQIPHQLRGLIGLAYVIPHQLCSLIGLAHVIAGNPTNSWIVIAIVLLGTRIEIGRSKYNQFFIVWQALYSPGVILTFIVCLKISCVGISEPKLNNNDLWIHGALESSIEIFPHIIVHSSVW